MKCSHCGEEMTIKKIQVDTDRHGNPIYHRYALCYHCKIKRNLDQPKRTNKRKKQRKKLIWSFVALITLVVACTTLFFVYQQLQAKQKPQEDSTVIVDTRKNLIPADTYAQLKTGMTLSNVEDLIGTAGNRLLQTTKEDVTLERYQWITQSGNGTVTLSFTDDMLTNISQTGIEQGTSELLNDASIASVKQGMTYKNVTAILGNGNRMSETIAKGVTTTIYTWETKDHSTLISIVFENGKVVNINSEPKQAEQSNAPSAAGSSSTAKEPH